MPIPPLPAHLISAFLVSGELTAKQIGARPFADVVNGLGGNLQHIVAFYRGWSAVYGQFHRRLGGCQQHVGIAHQDEWLRGLAFAANVVGIGIKVFAEVESGQIGLVVLYVVERSVRAGSSHLRAVRKLHYLLA